jgi:enoyl-CoA hydratase/carnithine racemase
MSDRISVTIDKGVADVRLTRADKMNALDNAMFEALVTTGEAVSKDESVRCVVLSGEGRAFCAGLDMGNFGQMASGESGVTGGREPLTTRTHGIANRAQQAAWVWRQCPVPVIAAVHGVALGGGFQVMLGSDIRITHPDTKLSVLEIKWGLVPDMGGTAIMRHLAREDIIRELTFTGRIFSGTEAHEYGFATRLSDNPHEDAMAMAREIATKSPTAIQASKRIFNAVGTMTDAEALLQESVEQDKIIAKGNQVEAVLSVLQKREPAFVDHR